MVFALVEDLWCWKPKMLDFMPLARVSTQFAQESQDSVGGQGGTPPPPADWRALNKDFLIPEEVTSPTPTFS